MKEARMVGGKEFSGERQISILRKPLAYRLEASDIYVYGYIQLTTPGAKALDQRLLGLFNGGVLGHGDVPRSFM